MDGLIELVRSCKERIRKLGASIGRVVDGPRWQWRGRAVRSERAALWVDAKGARMVRLADEPADA